MAALSDELTLLYIGYFNRLADPEGAVFWQEGYDSGFPLEAIAEDFSIQAEAIAIYTYFGEPSVGTPAFFLTEVYTNLFNRIPDGPGLTFWSGYIEAGGRIGDVILSIIEGAAPEDRAVLDAKLQIAEYWCTFADSDLDFEFDDRALVASRNALKQSGYDDEGQAEALSDVRSFFSDEPSLALTPVLTSLSEASETSTRSKVADIAIFEASDQTSTLKLSGADAALFEIVGSELFLRAGSTMDFETKSKFEVTVGVFKSPVSHLASDSEAVSIRVADVNEPPSVSLNTVLVSLAEDLDPTSRIKVAEIIVTDDALGNNVYSLSGPDAAIFEIIGTALYLRAGVPLDFETDPSFEVTVRVSDQGLSGFPADSASLLITVGDINEAPSVALSNTVTSLPEDEDTTTRIKIADIVVTDDALGEETLSCSPFQGLDTRIFSLAWASVAFEWLLLGQSRRHGQ